MLPNKINKPCSTNISRVMVRGNKFDASGTTLVGDNFKQITKYFIYIY